MCGVVIRVVGCSSGVVRVMGCKSVVLMLG